MNNTDIVKMENPWLLFIALGLAIVVTVFFVLLPKDKRSRPKNIISYVLHLVISCTLALAFANIQFLHTSKDIEVYVVADCSASEKNSADEIDAVIKKVYDGKSSGTKVGTIVFGESAEVYSSMGGSFKSVANVFKNKANDSFSYSTNISSALTYASEQFSENCFKKIILISDGMETDNSVIDVIDNLISQNIEIDTVKVDDNISDEYALTSIQYVEYPFVGKDNELKMLVRSKKGCSVKLSVTCAGKEVFSKNTNINPGLNTFTTTISQAEAGTYEYEVKITGGSDSYQENNTRKFSQTYSTDMNILFIGDTEEDTDAYKALNVYGSDVKVTYMDSNTENIPYKLEDLIGYDQIILSNFDIPEYFVDSGDTSKGEEFVSSLETLVRVHGKSVLTFGDTHSSTLNENSDNLFMSNFNTFLPVQYDADEAKAIVFLIDNSGSMATDSRIEKAKKGAIACLDELDENDFVSVVTFETNVALVQPLTSVKNKATITRNINKIQSAGSTYMDPGLALAKKQLEGSNCEYKYVITLSDGQPFEANETLYKRVKTLANANITCSFINISDNSSSSITLLRTMANYGNGVYKYISSASQIMTAMKELVVGEINSTYIDDDEYEITYREYNDSVLEGTNHNLNNIYGFNYARIRSAATTVLTVNYQEESQEEDSEALTSITVPLYAYWTYGKGTVASFAGSLSSEDTQDLRKSTAGKKFFNNMCHNALPAESSSHILTLDSTVNGISTDLSVSPNNGDKEGTITAKVTDPSGNENTYSLIYDGSNYITSIPSTTAGKYTVELDYKSADQSSSDSVTYSVYYDYSSEYDFFTNADNTLLAKIASKADGKNYASASYEYKLEASQLEFTSYNSTMMVFLLISVVLFLADVFVRKSDFLFKKKKATNTISD